MTDKELKKLKRNELLELLFYLQREFDELKQENENLKHKLDILEKKSLEADDKLSKNDLSSISDVVKSSIGHNKQASDNIIEGVESLLNRWEDSKKSEYRLAYEELVQISTIVKDTYSNSKNLDNTDDNLLGEKDLKSIAVVTNNIMKHYHEINRNQGILHEKDFNSMLKIADYALNHYKPQSILSQTDLDNICEAVKKSVIDELKKDML